MPDISSEARVSTGPPPLDRIPRGGLIADRLYLPEGTSGTGKTSLASILKNRAGAHDDTIRAFMIDREGIRTGEALTQFSGILTGTPTYVGAPSPLMEPRRPIV